MQPALRTRDLLALDVTQRELAGPRWFAPHRGVHLPTGAPLDDPLQRILAAAELLPPTGAVGGWAAAYVLGCRALDGRGPSGLTREPVPIILPPPTQLRPRRGLRIVYSACPDDDVVEVAGVRITSAARTAFDIARLSTVDEAVVGLDALCGALRLSPMVVQSYAASRPGWRGVPVVRRAVALADPRARSAGESRLRVLWRVAAALPRPEVNPAVLDAYGRLLRIVDLLDAATGLLGEYDGAGHRDVCSTPATMPIGVAGARRAARRTTRCVGPAPGAATAFLAQTAGRLSAGVPSGSPG